MKRTKLLTIVIIQLLTSLHLMAQTDPVFKLEKDNGHFFLQTTVNRCPYDAREWRAWIDDERGVL